MAKKEAAPKKEAASTKSKVNDAGDAERDNLVRKAYGAATQELRDAHRDEFNEAMVRHAKDLGVDWKPRPSAEQKAQEQLEALLEQYPHLRDRLADDEEADEDSAEDDDHAADEEDEEGGEER